jgi:hypothetical protein
MKRAELGLLEVLGLVVNAGGGECVDQIVKDKETLVKGFMERNKEDEQVFGIIDGTALNVSKC